MRSLISAVALLSLVAVPVSGQEGRVVLIAKDLQVLPDGRVTISLPSGDTITVKQTDVDLKAMQAMARQPAVQARAAEPDVKMLPTHDVAMPGIKAKCAKEWPTDFSMQQYCQTQQREGLSKLWARDMLGSAEGRMIRSKCHGEWPDDFSMRDYCENEQVTALAAIK